MYSLLLFVRIAFRNLRAYWRQSLAAIISVIAGFTAFVIFHGYLLDIYRAYTDFNERLEMHGDLVFEKIGAATTEGRADPWDYALSEEDQSFINTFLEKHRSQIESQARFLNISGSIDTSTASSVFQGVAYDVNGAADLRGHWRWDSYWGKPFFKSTEPDRQMMIGMRMAQKINCLPDKIKGLATYITDLQYHPQERAFDCEGEEFQLSAMTERGQINATDLSVIGIQDKGFIEMDNRWVVLSMSSAQKLFDTKKVSYYSVKVQNSNDLSQIVTDFNTESSKARPNLHAIHWKDHPFGELYQKTLSLLDMIRIFLISIIIFVGAMSVFNTLVKVVRERTQEIGMMRSLGYRSNQIRLLFFIESFFLSGVGCIIGGAISLTLSLFFNSIRFTYPSGQFSFESPFLIKINVISYLYGFGLMTLIAFLACLIAVHKPSRDRIVNLLIHT